MKVLYYISFVVSVLALGGCGRFSTSQFPDSGSLSPESQSENVSSVPKHRSPIGAAQGSSVSNGGSLHRLLYAFEFWETEYVTPEIEYWNDGRYLWPNGVSIVGGFPSMLLNQNFKPSVTRFVYDTWRNRAVLQIDETFLEQLNQPKTLSSKALVDLTQLLETTIKGKVIPLLYQKVSSSPYLPSNFQLLGVIWPRLVVLDRREFTDNFGNPCDARVVWNSSKNEFDMELKASTWDRLRQGNSLDPVGVALLVHELVRYAYFIGNSSVTDEDYAISSEIFFDLML